jgi:peptidoglycan/xylan/chitin deacetylase (PgdA/CDA1 family)
VNAFKLGGAFSRLGRKFAILPRRNADTSRLTDQNAAAPSKSQIPFGVLQMSQFAGLRVLCFHSVSDLSGTEIARYGIPKNEFKAVIDTLLNRGFDFIDAKELFDYEAPARGTGGRDVLITFDDGYQDVLDAFDILKEREIRALVFPVSSLIGAANNWDKDRNIPNLPLLTGDQLKFLEDNGWMVGSHTHTHPDLRSLDDSAVIREILQSISVLKSLGLRCAMALAYPYGFHNDRIAVLAMKAGLSCAFTTKAGFITEHTGPMTIPRIEVYRGELGNPLVNKVLGPIHSRIIPSIISCARNKAGKFRFRKFRQ